MKKTFEQWMKEVNAILASKLGGLNSDALPDVPYDQWYDAGVSAKRAASKAIANA